MDAVSVKALNVYNALHNFLLIFLAYHAQIIVNNVLRVLVLNA